MFTAGKKRAKRKMDKQMFQTAIYVAAVGLLLGCLVLIVIYRASLRQIDDVSRQMALTRTQQISETLDFQVGALDNLSIEFSLDSDMMLLANETNISKSEYYKAFFRVTNRMEKYATLHQLIDSIYIYMPDSGRVITDSSYSYRLGSDALHIAEDDISVIGLKLEDSDVVVYDAAGNELPADQTIRIIRKPWRKAANYYCVITMRKAELTALAQEVVTDVGGLFWVYDGSGRLVFANTDALSEAEPYANDRTVKIENRSYILNEAGSDYTGWRIVTAIPSDSFYIGYEQLRVTIGILLGIVMLLSLGLGFAVATQVSKPLYRLYETVRGQTGGTAETERQYTDRIQDLACIYETILDDRKRMKQTLEINMPQLRERFLIGLLTGENYADATLRERMQFIGVVFPYDTYMVAIVDLSVRPKAAQGYPSPETDILRGSVERVMEEMTQVYTLSYAPGRIAMILNYPAGGIAEVFAGLAGFHGEKRIRNIGVSTSAPGIGELPWLFLEAERALDYAGLFEPGEIIRYENINDIPTIQPVYPFDLEQRLLAAIRACDEKTVRSIAGEIGDYLQKKAGADNYLCRQILRYLAGSIKHLFRETDAFDLETEKELEKQLDTLGLAECLAVIEAMSMQALSAMRAKKEGKNRELVDRAFAYIEGHYDEDITVDDIAASLYISVPYLYKLFRQEGAVSPVAYLTQVRLRSAARLLRETGKQVGTIALSCGFESIQSFNRQFKKSYGCPPSEYRQYSHQSEQKETEEK